MSLLLPRWLGRDRDAPAVARRRFIQGLGAVLILPPGGAVWPVGNLGVRLNDPVAPNGAFLPAANMSMTVAGGLTNGADNQTVGTATCAGIDPARATWFFLNADNCSVANTDATYATYNGPSGLFAVAPVAGQGIAAATLTAPLRLAARPEGHTVVMGVTDGLKTCLRSFNVPCAWATPAIPTLFVGRGMLAAQGSNVGYEHFSDLLPRLSNGGGPLEAGLRGATVIWMPDSDRDYYAGDCAAGENGFAQNYATRFGIPGPIKFAASSQTGPRVRVGGLWGSATGGSDMATKGFFNIGGGDFDLRGFEVAFCNGPGSPDTDSTHGISGVRVNGSKYGDFTVLNCAFHDCNNGVETGSGPMKITIRNCIAFNNGGQTVSSGQTHAFYVSGSYLDFQGNVSFNNNVGHDLKTRCFGGIIAGNTLADGENGSCSQPLNIPQGGRYLVQGNTFQKGVNQQNPAIIGYIEDGYGLDRDHTLTITGNTFILVGAPGLRSGQPTGVFHFPRQTTSTGAPSSITADGNAWYLSPGATKFALQSTGVAVPNPWTETNAVTLALPPGISFADPGTATPPVGAPGFYNYLRYYGDDIKNMDGVQIKSDVLDIRIPASGSAGALLTTLRPFGARFYANDSPTDPRINPFSGTGNAWTLTNAPEYFGATSDWADNARFTVVAAPDGQSATVRVGSADLPAGVYRIKLRATAAGGTVADWRLYVVAT